VKKEVLDIFTWITAILSRVVSQTSK